MRKTRILMRGPIAGLSILLFLSALTVIARGQSTGLIAASIQDQTVTANSTGSEKERIEKVVREYLLKNPAIIREALQALQAADEKERQDRAANNLKELSSAIYSDPDSPIGGNAKADSTVVVFFDYNCGYCKKTVPELEAALSRDPSLRIIYKEFPILGQQSFLSAQAALAAGRQGKYLEFHRELMASQAADEPAIKSISDRLGLNYATLRRDMEDPKINEQIDRNIRLANSLDINGTPAYIVGDQIIPGAIDAGSLASMIAAQRSKSGSAIAGKEAPGSK